jgi:hypothetical protein
MKRAAPCICKAYISNALTTPRGAARLDCIPTQRARRYTQVSGRHEDFRHPGRDCRDPEAMDGNIEAGTGLPRGIV